jgi:hypothetical protein
MRKFLSLILGLGLAGHAAAADDCSFLQGSSLRSDTDRITAELTPEALATLRQQYYPQGFVSSFLQQSCAIGEPMASQLSFILTSFMSAATADEALHIELQNSEELSPYTFQKRVVTVWVQGVETTIALPQTSLRFASAPAREAYAVMDASLPEVIGAAYFSLAKLSEQGPVYGLQNIIKAESRFESGILYRLTLELSVSGQSEVHEVIVRAQPWTRSWQLVSDTVRS